MSKLFPRGFRVRYWHRHLRRDVFIAIGLFPAVIFLITIIFRLLAIMPPSKGLVSFTKALFTQVDWLDFVHSLLPGLYVTLVVMVILVVGAFYWYFKTYQFQGFWATVFRLERLSNWLIANQYYLVKEVD
ncbi:hypothetical protein LCIT_06680 [Leuconostoc citreum]|uniref:ABC transporter ATP-binding protein n=1 Tax=Leuconostoc citreum TaxID=33964 RepID=A0A5A5U061_LEUCI|nr:hypothetical protein [Leuconostoc citreum]GDZ83426.1 hypothetical protein LCIT_06680 [Leuconostoc citreum]